MAIGSFWLPKPLGVIAAWVAVVWLVLGGARLVGIAVPAGLIHMVQGRYTGVMHSSPQSPLAGAVVEADPQQVFGQAVVVRRNRKRSAGKYVLVG